MLCKCDAYFEHSSLSTAVAAAVGVAVINNNWVNSELCSLLKDVQRGSMLMGWNGTRRDATVRVVHDGVEHWWEGWHWRRHMVADWLIEKKRRGAASSSSSSRTQCHTATGTLLSGHSLYLYLFSLVWMIDVDERRGQTRSMTTVRWAQLHHIKLSFDVVHQSVCVCVSRGLFSRRSTMTSNACSRIIYVITAIDSTRE